MVLGVLSRVILKGVEGCKYNAVSVSACRVTNGSAPQLLFQVSIPPRLPRSYTSPFSVRRRLLPSPPGSQNISLLSPAARGKRALACWIVIGQLPSRMFYNSHAILARKSPLGTVWIAAHIERKMKKPLIDGINIPSYADRSGKDQYRTFSCSLVGFWVV